MKLSFIRRPRACRQVVNLELFISTNVFIKVVAKCLNHSYGVVQGSTNVIFLVKHF